MNTESIKKKRNNAVKALIAAAVAFLLCACSGGGNKEAVKDIHTQTQLNYLNDAYTSFTQYAKGTEELSIPQPVGLKFKGVSAPYTVYISENEDMSGAREYASDTETANIYNLKIGTKYYVRAASGDKKTDVTSFSTADTAPRNLYIDGVTNARDVGGWKTVSGGNIILLNKDKLKDLFAVLGKEENYPLVFHCSIGTDRTGMVAFLINGLLGVSEEDLFRDFLFSNFGYIGSMRTQSIIQTYMDTVDLAGGATLSEKIENYLVSVGVAAEDIAVVRRMMTD